MVIGTIIIVSIGVVLVIWGMKLTVQELQHSLRAREHYPNYAL